MEKVSVVDVLPGPIPVLEALRDTWSRRELVILLAVRDIKVRFKQTLLGVAWAIIRPVVATFVFTFIFERIAGLSSQGVPYPLLALSGVLAWNFMSEGINSGSHGMLRHTGLITKVYFPRVIFPLAGMLGGLADLTVALLCYVAIAAAYGYAPGASVLLLPAAAAYGLVTAFGVSLWFSSLGVHYRDVWHALPFVLQILFWITPVGYGAQIIPDEVMPLYWCNPFVSVIELFRFTLLDTPFPPAHLMLISGCAGLLLLVTGLRFFQWAETAFADVI